jgi:hypothetical protein
MSAKVSIVVFSHLVLIHHLVLSLKLYSKAYEAGSSIILTTYWTIDFSSEEPSSVVVISRWLDSMAKPDTQTNPLLCSKRTGRWEMAASTPRPRPSRKQLRPNRYSITRMTHPISSMLAEPNSGSYSGPFCSSTLSACSTAISCHPVIPS